MIQDDVTDNRDVSRLIRDLPVAREGHLQRLLVTAPLQFYYKTDSKVQFWLNYFMSSSRLSFTALCLIFKSYYEHQEKLL